MSSGEIKSQIEVCGDPAPALPLPRVCTKALLGNSRELVIVHQEEEYRLRITRKGKLILTK
jgi:hemin uptake protein HemP